MSGRTGGGLVLPAKPHELDAEADQVQIDVDPEIVESLCPLEAAGESRVVARAVDDLVGSGDDVVGRCEVEDGGLAAGAGVKGQVLACAGGVLVEDSCAGWILVELAGAVWVVNMVEVLTLLERAAEDAGGERRNKREGR